MRLLDQVRHKCRLKHFSYRTEQAYVYWKIGGWNQYRRAFRFSPPAGGLSPVACVWA